MVPAGRPAEHVRAAVTAGAALGVPTVLLCSHEASPQHVAEIASQIRSADCTIIDLAGRPEVDLPRLRTSDFHDAMVGSRGDLPVKRNLGLLLGRLAGWRTVLFLDDDIVGLRPARLRRAVGALQHHTAVGLRPVEFADNSVVCHAYRLGGGRQGVFVSGAALAVRVDLAGSFFPETYNEDWLFLAPHLQDRTVTAVGTVEQEPFNPFELRHRATAEEFGDVLGEGLLSSLHRGPLQAVRSVAYWRRFLDLRARFLSRALHRCLHSDDPRAAGAVPALLAAEARRSVLSADILADYTASWDDDLRAWRRHLATITPTGDLRSAVKHLGLPAVTVRATSALGSSPADHPVPDHHLQCEEAPCPTCSSR